MTVSADLRDLYQEVILDHSKRPRNYHALPNANRTADGDNPLCGDQVHVFLRVDGERIADAAFLGTGCAISKASASLMTESVAGKSIDEVGRLFRLFHDVVRGSAALDEDALGKLAVLAGVSEFPARVKCATLAWHTLNAAIASSETRVTTE